MLHSMPYSLHGLLVISHMWLFTFSKLCWESCTELGAWSLKTINELKSMKILQSFMRIDKHIYIFKSMLIEDWMDKGWRYCHHKKGEILLVPWSWWWNMFVIVWRVWRCCKALWGLVNKHAFSNPCWLKNWWMKNGGVVIIKKRGIVSPKVLMMKQVCDDQKLGQISRLEDSRISARFWVQQIDRLPIMLEEKEISIRLIVGNQARCSEGFCSAFYDQRIDWNYMEV